MTICAIQGLRKAFNAAFRAAERQRGQAHRHGYLRSGHQQQPQHPQHLQHSQAGQYRQAHHQAGSSGQAGGFFQAAWQNSARTAFRHDHNGHTHWHERRYHASRSCPRWGDRIRHSRPGSLDFEPHLQLKRSRPKWCKSQHAPLFRARRSAEFNGWSLKFALLRAHINTRLRVHPSNCPGNAGRLQAEQARHEEICAKMRASFFMYRARQATYRRLLRSRISRSWSSLGRCNYFTTSRCWSRSRLATSHAQLNQATLSPATSRSTSAAPICSANVANHFDHSTERSQVVHRPQSFLPQRELLKSPHANFRPFYLTSQHTTGIRLPNFTSTFSHAPCSPALVQSASISTSIVRKGIHIPIAAAAKLGSLLKSGHALQFINVLFRLSVTLIPVSWTRAKWMRKGRLAQLAAGTVITQPSWLQIFIKYAIRGSLALPFILLAAVLIASLERTPITGRWRLVLLNRQEEAEIIDKVLTVGDTSLSTPSMTTSAVGLHSERDWLSIMRAVLGEEEADSGTLLGGKVLDASDWRVSLVSSVLSRLEDGISSLGDVRQLETEQNDLPVPPPLPRPVSGSPRTQHYQQRNAVLVIDRPEANAFSFGFYGSANTAEPGVIIVFTGAIDEILRGGTDSNSLAGRHVDLPQVHINEPEPNWLRSFFGNIVNKPTQFAHRQQQQQVLAVSEQQQQALAVLLSHELAHLALSHTIESYAQSTLLWPQLEKLGWDMLRVFIYPITAILGPFVQDAISATVKAGISETGGILPALRSSCESRKLETEADLVALRLLASAGIDPRAAVEFWEERLARDVLATRDVDISYAASQMMSNRLHKHSAEAQSFIHTHPPDIERVDAIRQELARWSIASAN